MHAMLLYQSLVNMHAGIYGYLPAEVVVKFLFTVASRRVISQKFCQSLMVTKLLVQANLDSQG